jgi:hypothetical protein
MSEPDEVDARLKQQDAQIKDLLLRALVDYRDQITATDARSWAMESARPGTKEGKPRPAWLKLALPDRWVRALTKPPEKASDMVLVIGVPRRVCDELIERTQSRIIRPGGVVGVKR